jgi:hypothetical protein
MSNRFLMRAGSRDITHDRLDTAPEPGPPGLNIKVPMRLLGLLAGTRAMEIRYVPEEFGFAQSRGTSRLAHCAPQA